jgi:radical SAM superfamily enzyme YgiQ (UPF0313 family)
VQMGRQILRRFERDSLGGCARRRSALLINPPVYDTQYWAEWAQPYGLLRIAALLNKYQYKRVELFDFMETDERRRVPDHRINPNEEYCENTEALRPISPFVIRKNGETLELFKRHFGKTWGEFDSWLDERGLTAKHPPNEIWISAIMTYWWESLRDLTRRLRRRFGRRTTIILGGIYPTLVPQHAARMTDADIVVAGEAQEANDLWTDLSLYGRKPDYAIITPSRGCPFNCGYCAQRALNEGRKRPRYRSPDDVLAEMKDKYDRYGIRDFAFYADYLLVNYRRCLMPILKAIVDEKLPFRLYAPEGFETRTLCESQKLVDLLKAAHLGKVYLPLEHLDHEYLAKLGRKHVTIEHFVRAVRMCEKAGFQLRNMDVNAFVLYGLPRERIDDVVKSVLFVSEIVGSIIPMLFTPVPTTRIYKEHMPFFKERGWDKALHMLNGKLYPFLEINEGSISDYIDLQRLMYTLNAHYRSRSFQVFGDTKVSQAFRDNLTNGFAEVIELHRGP